MDIYRELYFRGRPKELIRFSSEIKKYVTIDWVIVDSTNLSGDFLLFEYTGDKVEKAEVSIYIDNIKSKDELNVSNIIPLQKQQLTVFEYNKVLEQFYNDIIQPFKNKNTYITISELSSNSFDPLMIITQNALDKLKVFTIVANKSTGASHPLDRKRWFDFICQTVEDDKVFDYNSLRRFLQDEEYWSNANDNSTWSDEWAAKLAEDYISFIDVLQFYKSNYENEV